MRRTLRGLDIPDSVRLETGDGGLLRLGVAHPEHGEAQVYLHGAHVTGWAPPGAAPVLWMSPRTAFAPDAAIRGGVPICFPWFGGGPDGDLSPAHGYARLADWRLTSATESADGVSLTFALPAEGEPLEATYVVRVGGSLRLELRVRNAGERDVTYEAALHTYLAVSDVRQVEVTGLEGAPYLDRLGGPEPVVAPDEPIRFTGETDRIYLGSDARVEVVDPGAGRRIAVGKDGSSSTVVWNPWTEKAAGMRDVGADAWPGFLCVETANVRSDAVTLAPGQEHTMTAVLEVLPLG